MAHPHVVSLNNAVRARVSQALSLTGIGMDGEDWGKAVANVEEGVGLLCETCSMFADLDAAVDSWQVWREERVVVCGGCGDVFGVEVYEDRMRHYFVTAHTVAAAALAKLLGATSLRKLTTREWKKLWVLTSEVADLDLLWYMFSVYLPYQLRLLEEKEAHEH